MANTKAYVSAGKGGKAYIADLGTTLPTDTTTALDAGFADLGYVSEDGVVNTNTPESEEIKAWGGDTVLRTRTANDTTFTFKMLEYLKKIVQEVAYGSENVSGAVDTGMTVKDKPRYDGEKRVWVIDQIMTGNVKSRTVIPEAVVTAIGEIAYKDNEAAGYEITLGTYPDSTGVTVYEYLKAPAASGASGNS